MIIINEDDLKGLEKYSYKNPTPEKIEKLVDELADILYEASKQEITIYQDMDDINYYRLYSGCSAVEVFLENNKIQIDFDISWQLGSSYNMNYNLTKQTRKV